MNSADRRFLETQLQLALSTSWLLVWQPFADLKRQYCERQLGHRFGPGPSWPIQKFVHCPHLKSCRPCLWSIKVSPSNTSKRGEPQPGHFACAVEFFSPHRGQ
jgi:hypothetical protein